MKIKRILSAAVSVLAAVTAISAAQPAAMADTEPAFKNTITVSSTEITKKQAESDGTVTINFTLGSQSSAPKLAALGLHISFPENEQGRALTPVVNASGNYAQSKSGMMLTSVMDSPKVLENSVFVAAASGSDITKSGTIFSIKAQLPEDYEIGDVYPVEIVYVSEPSAQPRFVDISGDKVSEQWTFANGIKNGSVTVSDREFPLGDVNFDNSVDSSDAALILAYYARVQAREDGSFTEAQKANADFNSDETVDSSDAALILAAYAEKQADG